MEPATAEPTTGLAPAIGLLELDSIAVGIAVGDAMVKRAPVAILRAGSVQPGKYLVLVGGEVADVEEALDAGRAAGGGSIVGTLFLPNVHPAVAEAIAGRRRTGVGEALGIIETPTVAAIIDAADAGLKGARVALLELRLADGLGGKGYALFDGPVAEVEAAVELGTARIVGTGPSTQRVVAQLHAEMRENLEADARFGARVRTEAAGREGGRPLAPAARPRRGRAG